MLKGKNIVLYPIQKNDLEKLWQWINDREQVLFNAPYRPVSDEQHIKWFETIQKSSDLHCFIVKLKENAAPIGSCQLVNIHPIHRTAEVQIRIGEVSQRGKGYGTEALRLLMDFAFNDLNLHRVQLHVFSTNASARRVYEKIGFVLEGTMKEAAYIDGRYVDLEMMRLLKQEYVWLKATLFTENVVIHDNCCYSST